MKKIIAALIILWSTAVTARAASQAHAVGPGGRFGVGVVVGDPFGPTVKYWITNGTAIDAGIGFESDPVFYADFLWQSWRILPQPTSGKLGAYAGLGPRFESRDHEDDKFGMRVPFGVNYFIEKSPIEIFVEIVPVFQFTPDTDTELDGGVGVRFLFG